MHDDAPGVPEAVSALQRMRGILVETDQPQAVVKVLLASALPAILAATFADAADVASTEGYPEIATFLDTLSYQIRERTT